MKATFAKIWPISVRWNVWLKQQIESNFKYIWIENITYLLLKKDRIKILSKIMCQGGSNSVQNQCIFSYFCTILVLFYLFNQNNRKIEIIDFIWLKLNLKRHKKSFIQFFFIHGCNIIRFGIAFCSHLQKLKLPPKGFEKNTFLIYCDHIRIFGFKISRFDI